MLHGLGREAQIFENFVTCDTESELTDEEMER